LRRTLKYRKSMRMSAYLGSSSGLNTGGTFAVRRSSSAISAWPRLTSHSRCVKAVPLSSMPPAVDMQEDMHVCAAFTPTNYSSACACTQVVSAITDPVLSVDAGC
jgi:hypothetical protein